MEALSIAPLAVGEPGPRVWSRVSVEGQRAMKNVAVLIGHREAVTPSAKEFSRFFAMVANEGVRFTPVERVDRASDIAQYAAILVGAPRARLSDATLDALRAAVAGGARILLLGTAGGDQAPNGVTSDATNLSEVIPGLRFNNSALHYYAEMMAEPNLTAPVALGSLPGAPRGAQLTYVSGCTLSAEGLALVEVASIRARGQHLLQSNHVVLEEDDMLTAPEASSGMTPTDWIYLEASHGAGAVHAFGGCYALHNDYVLSSRRADGTGDSHNHDFAAWMLRRWLAMRFDEELSRRMRAPQRHRLLHGYPMAPMMARARGARSPWVPVRQHWEPESRLNGLYPGRERPALLGVLPHPYCNPTVRGCGFCTFPQEKLDRGAMPTVIERVTRDIEEFARERAGARIRVPAVYFGGATANLTPLPAFDALCGLVRSKFDVRGAEVTLEGVPAYFAIDDFALMKALRRNFEDGSPRISMGIQTLSPEQLERMGRRGFGDRETFGRVARRAREMGFATSCDLLINLPGQPLSEMLADVEGIAAMGFDQVCVYHLVLFEGLGTPWSENRSLLAQMRDNPAAFESFRLVRKRLYELGFYQTTLTNFERRGRDVPSFLYEPMGFQPDRFDLLGFGPAGISLCTDGAFRGGYKSVEPTIAKEFLEAPRQERRWFAFDAWDLRVLFITRGVARLAVDLERYEALFGSTLAHDFPGELSAVLERGLARLRGAELVPTTEGMFYADSIAGLFAWRRVQSLRAHDIRDDFNKEEEPGARGSSRITWRQPPSLRFHDPNIGTYGGMG